MSGFPITRRVLPGQAGRRIAMQLGNATPLRDAR